MKKYAFVAALVAATCWSIASKPMESVDRYNVVLVHGAADRWQGLDCDEDGSNVYEVCSDFVKQEHENCLKDPNGDVGSCKDSSDVYEYCLDSLGLYAEAYSYKENVVVDNSSCKKNSSGKMVCDTVYLPTRFGGIQKPDGGKGSSATGMVKELAPLLRDTILETPSSVYLQRPFTKPAASPADNGDEIGKSSWAGENKCSARRSLIEEAQQFKAKGADTLEEYRESPVARYRTIPSRNILIGHSMGGVKVLYFPLENVICTKFYVV